MRTSHAVLLSSATAVVMTLAVSGAIRAQPAADTPLLPRAGDTAVQIVEEESAVIEAVRRAEPAVVSVVISKDLPIMERYYENVPSPFGDEWDFRIPRMRQNGTRLQEVGGGTAFFVTSDGLLMTNRHVVSDENAEYSVLLNDGRTLPVAVVARDTANDIALLKAQEGGNYPFLTFAEGDPQLGQIAIAIGNALAEFRNTVSVGVVSGLQRSIVAGDEWGTAMEQLEQIIQTDAAINPGNSGGPLLDSRGNVLGMNVAVAGMAQSIGFAIPARDLRQALESYQEHGRIVHPYLGVRYTPVNEELRERNALDVDEGALVVRGETPADVAVIPGSPADKAGLQENDLILEVDGQKVTANVSLARLIQSRQPGDVVQLKILRDGDERTVTVTLEEQRE